MFLEVHLVYRSFFVWLMMFTQIYGTWSECFQLRYGKIYHIIPVGRNVIRSPKHYHSFHILKPSPWPFCLSLALLTLVFGILDFLTVEVDFLFNLLFGLVEVVVCLWCWWKDVVEESLTEHTKQIKLGISIGMVLFIISEVMFFFAFFWAFFHVSLSPSVELGCVWPPRGLESLVISPFGAPLLNTIILLSSGITVTCAHYSFLLYCYKQRKLANFLNVFGELAILKSMRYNYRLSKVGGLVWWKVQTCYFDQVMNTFLETFFKVYKHRFFYRILGDTMLDKNFFNCFKYFLYTLILAVFFTISQVIEYIESAVTISDGVYGSTFFVMTGFHGFHVIVGTIFLCVGVVRVFSHRYSFVHFIGLECAIWYWHFVDVVWLFLFIFVYYWGNAFVPILDLSMFSAQMISADFASSFQFDFQDSATVLMESIVDLHNYIMFYLWLVFGIVAWMLFAFAFLNSSSKFYIKFLMLQFLFFDLKTSEMMFRRGYYLARRLYLNRRFQVLILVNDVKFLVTGKRKKIYKPTELELEID